MDNVVSFGDRKPVVSEKPEPVQGVIDVLKVLMAEAEAGKLRGLVGAIAVGEEGAGYIIAGSMTPFPMIGVLEFVKSELVAMAADDE